MIVLWTLLFLWVFWCLYIFTMGLYRALLSGRLNGLSLFMCAPVVAVAFVVDLVAQFTVATVVFWEWPKEWLVTHRLRRYLREKPKTSKSYRFTAYLCKHLLDPFDPTGAHCDSDEPALKA